MSASSHFEGPSGEFLGQYTITDAHSADLLRVGPGELRIFWNHEGTAILNVDGIEVQVGPQELIFITEFHHIEVETVTKGLLFRFNRGFYCLENHDSEAGCRGMLFYGAIHLASIQLEPRDLEIFELLWKVFAAEMRSRDNLQLEMLRMLMKRWIILCTRVFRRRHRILELDDQKLQLVKEFNLLVEIHFRQVHDVQSYAAMLHRSPKTITNSFNKYHGKTPLQVIQERILLEARRLLIYSDKTITEIAYMIGFDDIQSFSRFFTNKTGLSPKAFREQQASN